MTSPTTLQQRLREIAATLTSGGEVDTLLYAADELGRVTSALAEAPHSTLCAYMVDHFREPCSCWKADPSPTPGGSITNDPATTITADLAPSPGTLDDALNVITSLTVAGPHGRVLGLLRIRHPRLEFRGPALTIHYDNPET